MSYRLPAFTANPFRFSTKFTDDESGLVYYGHRFYSATLGRFINRDPKEEQGGINLYGFCRNNPINAWDYLGLLPIFTIGGQSNLSGVDLNSLYSSWLSSGQSTPWISISFGSSSGYGLNWNPFGGIVIVVPANPVKINTGPTNNTSTVTANFFVDQRMNNAAATTNALPANASNWNIPGKKTDVGFSTATQNQTYADYMRSITPTPTPTPNPNNSTAINPSPVLTSAHPLQSTRYGDFSLKGSDGSSIILYDHRELGDYTSSTLFDAGSSKYNKMSNGNPLNASIDLANAGDLSYIESLLSGSYIKMTLFHIGMQ
jgi:RHS repeat-associated protein